MLTCDSSCDLQQCSLPRRLFLPAAYPICERQPKTTWATLRLQCLIRAASVTVACRYLHAVYRLTRTRTSTCTPITKLLPSTFHKSQSTELVLPKMMHIPAAQSPRNPNPGLVNIVVRFENAIVTIQGWLRQHLGLPVRSCLS